MPGVALVRRPTADLAEGIVTHIERVPVDVELAYKQHEAYCAALEDAGWRLEEVEPAPGLPDAVFVEDTVVVVGSTAVITRSGAPQRRPETEGTEAVVRRLGLDVVHLTGDATMDGGDVLQVGSTVYVGRGGRTNAEGIRQLRRHAATRGRTVVPVRLHGVLHLKSAVTALPDGTCLAHDVSLFDASPFPAIRRVPEEAGSHVILLGGGTLVMAASAPRSAELFDDMGFDVVTVDIAEFEKREGCVTCLSVLVADAAA